jgi:N-acetylmuramoyl-L-alanine amidase
MYGVPVEADMSESQVKVISMMMGVLLVASMLFVGRQAAIYVGSASVVQGDDTPCVIVDAGHGGNDPGKVGINGALEKDLNLAIALKVQGYLEANDIRVVMTRDSDEGLYDANASSKKVQDMKRRVALMDETAPDLAVSIHQNSYTEEYVHGAQVFYYTGSIEGQRLADTIQQSMVERVDPDNTRQVKPNNSYYLLKKTETPIVIVESGFLSNQTEADQLCSPLYQDRIAWAITMGILLYLNQL